METTQLIQQKLTLDDFQIESLGTTEEATNIKGGTAWLCIGAGIACLAELAHEYYHKYSGSTHTHK
jgi:hypothetical protein